MIYDKLELFLSTEGEKNRLLITGRVGRMENKPPTGCEAAWAAPPRQRCCWKRRRGGDSDVSHRWLHARMGIEELW